MKTCKISNCNKKHAAKGYCVNHYYQLKRRGKILERTKYTPNAVTFINDKISAMSLYNIKCEKTSETIISNQDIERCLKHKWYMDKKGYVYSRIDRKLIPLHRFITGFEYTDHKDGNPLNNVRDNLRQATHQENCANTSGRIGVSKYKGVYYNKLRRKWHSGFRFNKKYYHFGTFKTEQEAYDAYKKKIELIVGDFYNLRKTSPNRMSKYYVAVDMAGEGFAGKKNA